MSPYTYKYPMPAATVDAVLFSIAPPITTRGRAGSCEGEAAAKEPELRVLLIKRREEPCAGFWATPGGFMEIEERLDDAVRRELREETNITGAKLHRLGAFDDPHRDPRGRVISHGYFGILRRVPSTARAADDAAEMAWHPAHHTPRLAFDHAVIVQAAIAKLREEALRSGIAFRFLPRLFTIGEVRQVYEAIFNRRLNTPVFRQRLLASGLLIAAEQAEKAGPKGKLYRLDRKARIDYLRLPPSCP